MPLTALLTQPSVESVLQLLDVGLQPAGTLTVSLDLHESTTPQPILLRRIKVDGEAGRTPVWEPVLQLLE